MYSQPCLGTCTAISDYQDVPPGDLEFMCGDVIQVVEFIGDVWLCGQLYGQEGMFPCSFVRMEEQENPSGQDDHEKGSRPFLLIFISHLPV